MIRSVVGGFPFCLLRFYFFFCCYRPIVPLLVFGNTFFFLKALEIQGRHRDKEKWKLHFNLIIRSIKALPVSQEKSPTEISVKAQTHAND